MERAAPIWRRGRGPGVGFGQAGFFADWERRWRFLHADVDTTISNHYRSGFPARDVPRELFLTAGDGWRS